MAKATPSAKETEIQVPDLAKAATSSAYRRAMRRGSVVVYRNGEVRRIEAGGKSAVIKKLGSRVRIAKGAKIEIKPESA